MKGNRQPHLVKSNLSNYFVMRLLYIFLKCLFVLLVKMIIKVELRLTNERNA
jgi:hypothetical protein